MALILIREPRPEIRVLLEIVTRRLGHNPVSWDGGEFPDADLLILEPSDEEALALALSLRSRSPHLPIICLSSYPQSQESRELRPAAFLLKPFDLTELGQAITDALAAAGVQPPAGTAGRW